VSDGAPRTAIHARIAPDPESGYVATCEEIAVVTQGETLDEVTANLRDAVALHFEGRVRLPTHHQRREILMSGAELLRIVRGLEFTALTASPAARRRSLTLEQI
jgi:predicted RNase H-like HicB family nuclease